MGIGPCFMIRVGGGRTGEIIALPRARLTIGRRQDADIILGDLTVYSSHAAVDYVDGQHELQHLGSITATYVNGAPIERHPLSDGDRIQIGKYQLEFRAG